MTTHTSHFEKLSFWKLLTKHSVQIPVIQRDYAQGRESKVKVLEAFLNALKTAVESEPIELDFIYGDVKDDIFRPLDGQQRLTTLFLLHWYAARAAGLSLDTYKTILSRFSYDTRISSRDFCKELVCEAVALDRVSVNGSLSLRIKDCPWFVGAWDFDPTITGMLAALDKISKMQWPDDLWARLTSDDASPIRFVLVELEKFGLSDDLYIKMNARGKPLTAFENFKALLGERVSNEGWESDIDAKEQFAIRTDTRWTDCFWELCPPEKSGLKKIDGPFLAFITHSLACSLARHAATAEAVADTLQRILNDPAAMESKDFSEAYYKELRERLELLSKKLGEIRNEARAHWEFSKSHEASETSFLEEVLHTPGPQYKSRLILYAQLKLHGALEEVSQENAADWRRVVRNVIAHSVVESPNDFVAGIRLLDELAGEQSEGVGSIYSFLNNKNKIQSGFAGRQVEEELRKSRLIIQNSGQKKLLHRLEDTKFLQGRISFALDCVKEDLNLDFALLAGVASVIESEFNNDITPEIRRAFFTIGDGGFFRYWSSWFYTMNLPKYCLIENYNEFRRFTEHSDQSREALKSFVLNLVGKSCVQLINEYEPTAGTPNWRVRLIREPGLIERATAHYIALDEPGAIVYPIPGVRPHANATTQQYLKDNMIQ